MRSIKISKEVLSQELAGETVLLDMASEGYFGLDAVGTRVWQLLQSGAGSIMHSNRRRTSRSTCHRSTTTQSHCSSLY
jgi:hypothetical protein